MFFSTTLRSKKAPPSVCQVTNTEHIDIAYLFMYHLGMFSCSVKRGKHFFEVKFIKYFI